MLNFSFIGRAYYMLGIVRTLLDRNFDFVTEESDQDSEEKHGQKALSTCGYTKRTFEKVKIQIKEKRKEGKKKTRKTLETEQK